jgi:hypothetical protein
MYLLRQWKPGLPVCSIADAQHSATLPRLSNLIVDVPPESRQDFDRYVRVAYHLVQPTEYLLFRGVNDVTSFMRRVHRDNPFICCTVSNLSSYHPLDLTYPKAAPCGNFLPQTTLVLLCSEPS